MKFGQLLEGIDATRAHIQNTWGRSAVQSMHEPGFYNVRQMRERQGVQYELELAKAAQFLKEVFTGRRPMWQLKEALSTSDYPLMFGDTIDRMMLAHYRAVVPSWRDYVHVSEVADFRDVKRFKATRGAGRLAGPISQGESYPTDAPAESSYSYRVYKYGRRRDILWEALVNDDLDALKNAPDDLAYQASNTEYYNASAQFVNNTTLYATSGGGRPTGGNKLTLALTAENLQSAINQMATFKDDTSSPDSTGQPFLNAPRYLVVPPALELTARQILQSVTVMFTGSTDRDNLPTLNVLNGMLEIKVNHYIPIIDTTNGDTSWYLFADPANGWAVEFSFLRGYVEPQMFQKSPNQMALGGGIANPLDGDFDTDDVAWKVRHVMGGSHTNAVGGWRFSLWSDGTA